MKHLIALLFAYASFCFVPLPAAVAKAEDFVIRIEAPSADNSPHWLPLRVSVRVEDGRPVAAFATAQQLNVTWHEVDVSRLEFSEDRFSGSLGIRFRRDDIQQTARAARPDSRDVFSGVAPQVVQVSCPVSALAGTSPGKASWNKDELGGPRSVGGSTQVRAWREAATDPRKPQYLELFLLRWSDEAKGVGYDGMYGSASVLLRGALSDGKASKLSALQSPERYQMQYADLVWHVPTGGCEIAGDMLSGELVLAPGEKLRGKLSELFQPLPAQSLHVSFKAQMIGTTVAGTAQIQHEGKTVESMIVGRIRPFAHTLHADRTPRAWAYSAEPNPELIEAARLEAAVPIRPGEPGKREFWSDAVRLGGYDVFIDNDRRIVQFDGGPKRSLLILPEEEYRAKLKVATYSGISAPTFNLKPVKDAVTYRFTVQHQKKSHDPVDAFEHIFEGPVPWASLGVIWDKIPVHSGKHDANPYRLTVVGLNSQGRPVADPQTINFIKKAPFAGPYHQLPRSYRDAALLSARWMRDNPRNGFARFGIGQQTGHARGDGQLWYTTYSALYAGLTLCQLSTDPAERADALEQAIVVGDIWLQSMMRNYLPDTYKGWTFDQWVYGTAWLDLYRLTGDSRYREAVLEHARRLVAKQMPDGNWPDVEASSGHASFDPQTGRPYWSSLQGPSMQQWDPSSSLYYLGRIRKELRTDEFSTAEGRAYRWVMDNSVARMDWRKQGPHASEHHKMPWPVVPDCALHFFHYLALDLPGRTPDWDLMSDLLRWSEDRVVDWRRIEHPTLVYPYIGYNLNRDVQIRLAGAYATLAAHTGNPLHWAKSKALAGAVLVSQFPTTGQIPHTPNIGAELRPLPGYAGPGSGDGGNRGEYATMELLRLAMENQK